MDNNGKVTQNWPQPEAKWIGLRGTETETNLFLEFVRRFEFSGIEQLVVSITAVSRYILFINGTEIARGPAPSQPTLRYFHRHTIPAAQLRQGENLIAIRLHHDGATTETIQKFAYGQPGLLVAVQAARTNFVSDKTWQLRRSPLFSGSSMVSKWGGYKEFYHGDLEDGWQAIDYDHSSWSFADEIAPVHDAAFAQELVAVTLPELQTTIVHPAKIIDVHRNLGHVVLGTTAVPTPYQKQKIQVEATNYGAAPAIIFDFGREVVGYPEIHTSGGFCIYELWIGESLDLYRLDVVRAPASGIWKSFHRRAFRYLQIKFIAVPQPITLSQVAIHDTRYAYDSSGHLHSGDALTNQILAVSQETLRANTSFHYEDCPWREQALWVFDLRVMALQNYYFYGDAALVRKNLRQMLALQQADGSIPSTGPLDNNCYNLDFCMHLVATLREYFCYSGDKAFLLENGRSLDKLDDYIMAQVDDDGLMTTQFLPRGHAFLDWSREIARGPKMVILNALYARYLDDMVFLNTIREQESSRHEAQQQKLLPAARATFYDPQSGLFADTIDDTGTQLGRSLQGNMAAIYSRFLPSQEAQALVDKIAAFRPPYSPAFYFLIFEALAENGRFADIQQHIQRYWGGMLKREATTWWEVFDPDTPDWVYPHPFLGNVPTYEMDWIPTSACHGWSGTAGLAIPRHLLGIDLLQLWQNKIVVNPGLPGHFNTFSYKVPVRDGHLALNYSGNGQTYHIEVVEAPKGVELIINQPQRSYE
ncbi:hypothetical protein [Candidatus Leptofilum sp.]|uniref:alpha-L-rhamnosidase-related protein n=1 Tax=Candidatus Leptofilum sp. TaxID=3241576 RepID=UPI003B5B48AF